MIGTARNFHDAADVTEHLSTEHGITLSKPWNFYQLLDLHAALRHSTACFDYRVPDNTELVGDYPRDPAARTWVWDERRSVGYWTT